ncbi:hypothetical protein ScPMuIL_008641 [Solemya velum]
MGYGAPAGGYPQGGAPPQGPPFPSGAYPQGGPPPQDGGYPQAGPIQGAGPPAGNYQGGPPPGGAYPQGGPPHQDGGYPQGGPPQGAGPPAGNYQGGPPPGAQGQPQMPPQGAVGDPTAQPVPASAPSIDKMDKVDGYGNIGFESGGMLAPPAFDDALKGPPPERTDISNVPTITEQDARDALLQFVAEHCCYGKKAAQDMTFRDLQSTSAFHYTLETFAEGRQTCWAYEPFKGQTIDGPFNGLAPGPWDIQMQPTAMFQNSKMEMEVPHTASVKPCHGCMAMGRIQCKNCHGRGRVHCDTCHGSGRVSVYRDGDHHHEHCTWCHGEGRRHCHTCHGDGMVTCHTCKGCSQLKCYIKLTVLWNNHVIDHIVERTALPDHLIRSVTGQIAFEESQLRVWPINHFPDAEINNASQRLVNQHSTAFPSERILMQRHNVRIIPVTQAIYTWKEKQSNFFVYGFENQVHAPDYPQTCCCGCVLI